MGNLMRLVLWALAGSTAFATEAEKLCADAKVQTEDNDEASLNDKGPRWYGPVVKGNTTRLENSMKGCCKTKPFTVKMDKLTSKWTGHTSGDIECFWRCDLAEEWPEDNKERTNLINDSYDCFIMKSPWEVEFASKPKFLPPEMYTPPSPGGEIDDDDLARAGLPPNEDKDDDEEDEKEAKDDEKKDDEKKDDEKKDDEKKDDEKKDDEKKDDEKKDDEKKDENKDEAGDEEKEANKKDDEGDEKEEKKEDDDSGALLNKPNMALAAVLVAGLAML